MIRLWDPNVSNTHVTVEKRHSFKINLRETISGISPKYVFLIIYSLMIIFSVEGLVAWCIGLSGAYKTLKIYKNQEENPHKKATKILLVLLIIIITYNLSVYHLTKFLVLILA